jgi:hypothetical protein
MQTKVLVVIMLVALLLIAARMMDPAIYQIDWWTVNGGGGVSSGGSYSLSATIGQADAGTLSGGEFLLAGGFWGGAFATYNLNLPIILR